MAGKISKDNYALLLAKLLLVNKDLKAFGIQYEDNPERVPMLLFAQVFPTVLENLSQTYPEFVPIYEKFSASAGAENSYPDAYVGVFDDITDGGLFQTPPISTDARFCVLMAALFINVYSDNEKPFAERLISSLEKDGDVTDLHELALLATALYGYNYEGDFRDLVAKHYYQLKAEGFGESVEEIKAQPVQRERDLNGCTILANECGRVDREMDDAVYPEGSLMHWNQTNGSQAWLEWIGESDLSWFTQSNSSLWNIIHNGNKVVISSLDNEGETFGQMCDITKSILKKAHNVAEECNKPFNVSVSGDIVRKRTVSVDVPYEVKVGLFKKETRYRKEQKTESYKESATVHFNGWLLDHFERIEDDGDSAAWDYCLGSDGGLYVITSVRDSDGTLQYKVSEMLGNFESFFRFAAHNTFISVSHGWMGALDAVAMIPYTQRKYSTKKDGETYVFDFPLQLSSRDEYPFPKEGDGLKARLDALLQ